MSHAKGGTAMAVNSAKNLSKIWGAIFVLALCSCPMAMQSQSVTLIWDPSSSADVAGYMIYYGTDGTNFDNALDAGASTTVTVPNLQPGTTNYFEVVAYDTNNLISRPSNLLQ